MDAGLVKGEGFAVDASVLEANASRYHGKAPDEIAWAEPGRQSRAVKEYLAGLDVDAQPNADRKPPKLISPSDPCSAWTAKANKRVQFGYGLNDLIDIANAIIVDVEPTPARTYARSTQQRRCLSAPSALRPEAEAACGRHCLWDWPLPGLAGWPQDCTAHPGPRCQRARRRHLSRSDFRWDRRRGVYVARTTSCYTPPVPCTTAKRFAIAPPSSIAKLCTQDAVLSQ